MPVSSNLLKLANIASLTRLIIDKGAEAFRITLDAIHPPANLLAVLKRNRACLRKLKPRVINDLQWDLLFPPSGNPPDSKTFDVTLLTVLLRIICWSTHPPVTGWNTMPPETDRSPQANVLRIKLLRNEVYAHVTSTGMDEATFENLWQKISQALVDLNIPRKEIDDLKISSLDLEEESYVQKLKEWFVHEEDFKNILDDPTTNVKCLKTDVHSLTTDMSHFTPIAEENSQVKHERDKSPKLPSVTANKKNDIATKRDFLKTTFLDSDCSIKEEVHEKLKRFPWLCGAYGITGPNKKIPYPHLYVTVKKGSKKSDVLKDLKSADFGCKPKKWFELRREPERKPTFKFLSRSFKSGGGVVAVDRQKENHSRVPEEIDIADDGPAKASGTLTLFCFQEGFYYALTCFHITCKSIADSIQIIDEVFDIREKVEWYKQHAKEQQIYYYKESRSNQERSSNPIIHLGEYSMASFDSKSDVMSIKVREDIEINCEMAEVRLPGNWNDVWSDLYNKTTRGLSTNHVEVSKKGYSSDTTHGCIIETSFTYFSESRNELFKNAIVIKGEGTVPFLQNGDSGALVWRLLDDNQKQAFAYGVSEADSLYQESTSFNGDSDDSEASSDHLSSKDDSSDLMSEEDSDDNSDLSGKDADKKNLMSKNHMEATIKSEETNAEGAMAGGSSESEYHVEIAQPPFYICLRLDTALENLDLSNAACFQTCGRN